MTNLETLVDKIDDTQNKDFLKFKLSQKDVVVICEILYEQLRSQTENILPPSTEDHLLQVLDDLPTNIFVKTHFPDLFEEFKIAKEAVEANSPFQIALDGDINSKIKTRKQIRNIIKYLYLAENKDEADEFFMNKPMKFKLLKKYNYKSRNPNEDIDFQNIGVICENKKAKLYEQTESKGRFHLSRKSSKIAKQIPNIKKLIEDCINKNKKLKQINIDLSYVTENILVTCAIEILDLLENKFSSIFEKNLYATNKKLSEDKLSDKLHSLTCRTYISHLKNTCRKLGECQYIPTKEKTDIKQRKIDNLQNISFKLSIPKKTKRTPDQFKMFSNDKRHGIMAEYPNAKLSEIAKILDKQWKQLSEDEKEDYQPLSKYEKKKPNKEIKKARKPESKKISKKESEKVPKKQSEQATKKESKNKPKKQSKKVSKKESTKEPKKVSKKESKKEPQKESKKAPKRESEKAPKKPTQKERKKPTQKAPKKQTKKAPIKKQTKKAPIKKQETKPIKTSKTELKKVPKKNITK
jgi:hypothetical protein